MNAPLLTPPDLVFRIGFAGQRLGLAPENLGMLQRQLGEVFSIIEQRLREIAQAQPDRGMFHFYSKTTPLLRLVTGLAEGADALAAKTFLGRPDDEALNRTLAAILPFDTAAYWRSRESKHQEEFAEYLAECDYVLELDGVFEKDGANAGELTKCRGRAYRAQSTVLLRHCDLLVAMFNPIGQGLPGGTLETVQNALAFDLPVVVLNASSGEFYFLEKSNDLHELHASDDPTKLQRTPAQLRKDLANYLNETVRDPGRPSGPVDCKENQYLSHDKLFAEFFGLTVCPPCHGISRWNAAFLPRVESCFNASARLARKIAARLRRQAPSGEKTFPPTSDLLLEPFDRYYERASKLNHQYASVYRGTFILNYTLAVLAVTLAAGSLLLSLHHGPKWASVGCAAAELVTVASICWNTRQANRQQWNDKAIDYRYLAERLRTSFYLPRAGSLQSPAADRPQLAARASRQNVVDWFFDALTRHVSPQQIPPLKNSPAAAVKKPEILRVNPRAALQAMRQHWIPGQQHYHQRTRDEMDWMQRFLEGGSSIASICVIVVVSTELLLAMLEWHDDIAPWLAVSAAVLPAAIASLNGLQFQSECRRQAERSGLMLHTLAAIADRANAVDDDIERSKNADRGGWTPKVLHLVEECAEATVREVAEWSVLYSKGVPET